MKKLIIFALSISVCSGFAQTKSKDCPLSLRLSGSEFGCILDYKFSEKNDPALDRKIKDIVKNSRAYLIAVSAEQKCESIAVGVSSYHALDLIQSSIDKRAIKECEKAGCKCSIAINDGIVIDAPLFRNYVLLVDTNELIKSYPKNLPYEDV
jgi:hypothetical protein